MRFAPAHPFTTEGLAVAGKHVADREYLGIELDAQDMHDDIARRDDARRHGTAGEASRDEHLIDLRLAHELARGADRYAAIDADHDSSEPAGYVP